MRRIGLKNRNFDQVRPTGFELHRRNNADHGEKLADFPIDKPDVVKGGYRFTVTELIPPNGARGHTTTINIVMTQNYTATIPEWKRSNAIWTDPQPLRHEKGRREIIAATFPR